jgi:hypothetical protein
MGNISPEQYHFKPTISGYDFALRYNMHPQASGGNTSIDLPGF